MYSTSVTVVILSLAKVHECMQKFICLLPGRGVCLGAIVWMIKLRNAQEYSKYSVMLKFVLVLHNYRCCAHGCNSANARLLYYVS